MIGVDADVFETDPNTQDVILTSILKNMKVSTYEAIMSAGSGDDFDFTPYIGTLENDGVGLAPFHNFESKVSDSLAGELDDGEGRHHRRLDPGEVVPVGFRDQRARPCRGRSVSGRPPPSLSPLACPPAAGQSLARPTLGCDAMKLELRDITKRFGTLVANDRISLTVEPGEIHCLLGENGAGKSTLMNVLYGLYRADEGEILLDDEVQHFTGPGDAIAAGIGMVHQHFMLIPVFTVAENVMLGNEATGFAGSLDLDAARKRVAEISKQFGFHVNPGLGHRGPPRRRAAAGRDHQGPLPRRRGARLRRAHRRADAAGDRRADGRSCASSRRPGRPSSSSPTSSARCARSPTGSP